MKYIVRVADFLANHGRIVGPVLIALSVTINLSLIACLVKLWIDLHGYVPNLGMKFVLAGALLVTGMDSIKQLIKTGPHMNILLRAWADEGLALQRNKNEARDQYAANSDVS